MLGIHHASQASEGPWLEHLTAHALVDHIEAQSLRQE